MTRLFYEEYVPRARWLGGTIVEIEMTSGDDAYVDLERQLLAALARD